MIRRCTQRSGITLALVVAFLATFAVGVAWAAWRDTSRLQGTATSGYRTPVLLRVPHIDGTPTDGETLTAVDAQWSGLSGVASRGRQWFRCSLTLTGCTAIAGATGTTYVVPAGAIDTQRFVLRETVTNGTTSGTAVSLATEVQAPGSALGVFRFSTVTTVMPQVTGTATSGQTLTATAGTWTSKSLLGDILGAVASTTGYQWIRCGPVGNTATPTVGTAGCTDIAGATTATYVLQASDVGQRIRARVTRSSSVTVTLVVSVLLTFAGTIDTQATPVVVAP